MKNKMSVTTSAPGKTFRIIVGFSLTLLVTAFISPAHAGVHMSQPIPGMDDVLVAKTHATNYGGNQSVGRMLYTGNAPKIVNPTDLEIYVSKTMLTVRAKAWVSNEQLRKYPSQLLLYWNAVREAFDKDSMTFVPLVNMDKLAAQMSNQALKAEVQLVSKLYSKDSLEDRGVDIYQQDDPKQYKQNMVLALLRSYTLDSTMTLADGLKLVELAKANQDDELNQLLPSLLERQLKDNLTKTDERADHIGFLTFVYPIAATTAGPFSIDSPGVYHLGQFDGDESRWHSFKWNDEFGGLPFMQYTDYGVAFHGPITQFGIPSIKGANGSYNFWYLKRGYVSHGCHRMDPNDLMELRNLLPAKITRGTDDYKTQGVQVVTKVYPDTDLVDGRQVVFNVDYYTPTVSVRSSETIQQAVDRNSLSNQRASFLTSKITNLQADPQTGRKDTKIENISADPIQFDGIQPIKVENNSVVKEPVLDGVELKNYAYRGVRLIQYEEAGVKYSDSSTNDNFGKYPPSYFTQQKYLNQK